MSTHAPGDHDIELVTGDYLNLVDPDPSVITLDVIAHGLSNTCRYAGQTKSFYSVAEHAGLVTAKLGLDGYPLSYQIAGLHHDDAEAFIADIARPLKSLLQPAYDEISDRLDRAIAEALGIPLPAKGSAMDAAVKAADDWALAAEAYHLMPSRGRGWWCEGLYDPEDRRLVPQGETPGWGYDTFIGFHNGILSQQRVTSLRRDDDDGRDTPIIAGGQVVGP
jgi:5'-nucleotidase